MTREDWDTCLAIILAEDLLAELREVETAIVEAVERAEDEQEDQDSLNQRYYVNRAVL